MVALVTTSLKYCPAGITISYVRISPVVTPAGMLTFVEVVTVEGKTHNFWKHMEDYKITWKEVMDSGFPRPESHERWASYSFPKIWNNPDLPEKVKWTNIAVAYVNQMKNQSKMGQYLLIWRYAPTPPPSTSIPFPQPLTPRC